MFTVLIAIIGTLLFVWLFRGTQTALAGRKSIPALDYHKIRDNEMVIWGEHFTELQCKNNCKKCKQEKSLKPVLPNPPKGPGAGSRPRSLRVCSNCCKNLYAADADTCHACTLDILKRRRQEREWEEKKAASRPRVRQIPHGNEMYRAHVPSEVPDNAHVEIMLPDYSVRSQFIGTWAVWKWTDQTTGRQMVLRSTASQVMERHDVMSGDSDGPVQTFYTPLEVETPKFDWIKK